MFGRAAGRYRSAGAIRRHVEPEPAMRFSLPAMTRFPRVRLLEGITPIQRLHRLERALGGDGSVPRIFAKRDDLMGLGGGGNKLRKLEFLIGEALGRGCDTFITTGGRQSNHARLAAAAAAHAGLDCELVLVDLVERRDEMYRRSGNVLLYDLLGAVTHWLPAGEDPRSFAEARRAALAADRRNAYVVGLGGSSPGGCPGYVGGALEIMNQAAELAVDFAAIVVPNGSSGTHAGLAAGLAALGQDPGRVKSWTVLGPAAAAQAETARLAQVVLALIGADAVIAPGSIAVAGDQLGDGYGVPTDTMVAALRLLARTEGLLLDPVYSGKAFAGLLQEIRAGAFGPDDAVLFVMTGGGPGLFAYEPALAGGSIRAG